MTMEEWLEVDLNGNFRVQIPVDAKASLPDDGCTAVIRLDDQGDATEVLISNYPLGRATDDKSDHAGALRDVVADFFTRAVPKTLGHGIRFNIEVSEELDRSMIYAQGVGLIEKDLVWLVRAYARPGDDRFWLMHWHGPKDKMPVVLRIFVTFDPAE
jgi:hypothetical protein